MNAPLRVPTSNLTPLMSDLPLAVDAPRQTRPWCPPPLTFSTPQPRIGEISRQNDEYEREHGQPFQPVERPGTVGCVEEPGRSPGEQTGERDEQQRRLVPKEDGHRGQVQQADWHPHGSSGRSTPRELGAVSRRNTADLYERECKCHERRRVEVRERVARYADRTRRVPSDQDENAPPARPAGSNAEPAEPVRGERHPEQVRHRPTGQDGDQYPAERQAGPAEAIGDQDQPDQRKHRPRPKLGDDRSEHRGTQGEHQVREQEPQRVGHQRHHHVAGARRRPHGVKQEQRRNPDRGQPEHRRDEPREPRTQPEAGRPAARLLAAAYPPAKKNGPSVCRTQLNGASQRAYDRGLSPCRSET